MPTVDTNGVTSGGSASTDSVSLVHPGGTNNAILAIAAGYDFSASGAATVTWSGTESADQTLYSGAAHDDGQHVAIFLDKATETANVNWSGLPTDSGSGVGAVSLTFVAQASPLSDSAFASPGASTPDNINSGGSTSDGVVIGVIQSSANPAVAGGGTEVMEEADVFGLGEYMNVQKKAGTGSAVNCSWTVGGTTWSLGAFNIAHDAGAETVSIDPGAIAYAGQAVSLDRTISVAAGAIAYAGKSLEVYNAIQIVVGSIAYAGQALKINRTVSIVAGAIAYAGKATSLTGVVNVAAGAIAYAGKELSDLAQNVVSVTAGAIAYAGQAVKANQTLSLTAGAIAYVGKAAQVTLAGLGGRFLPFIRRRRRM